MAKSEVVTYPTSECIAQRLKQLFNISARHKGHPTLSNESERRQSHLDVVPAAVRVHQVALGGVRGG